MRKHKTLSGVGVSKSRYTKLVERLAYGADIYSHTSPHIAGAFIVVWPLVNGMRDWTAYSTLEQAEHAAMAEYYRGRASAGIGT